ncbi:unnamed protein product, partial [Polarella glacialis]
MPAALRRMSPGPDAAAANPAARAPAPSRTPSAPRPRASSPAAAAPSAPRATVPSAERRGSRTFGPTASSQAREMLQRQASPSKAAVVSADLRQRFRPPARSPARPKDAMEVPVALRRALQGAAGGNSSSSGSKQEAAMALRRIIPLKTAASSEGASRVLASPAGRSVGKAGDRGAEVVPQGLVTHNMASDDLWTSVVADDVATCGDSISSLLISGALTPRGGREFNVEISSPTCSPSACSGAGFVGGAGSSTADERMRQLILENQALREAFSDTQKRLMRLEDEKREFQDEGIYDVVNSICGKTSGTGRQPTVNDLNQVNDLSELSSNGAAAKGDTGAITYMMSGSNDLAACEPCPR